MPRSGQATILDVAREAGVSRQTVTRAMNDMSGISAATRARVLAAAVRLQYRPSRQARELVSRSRVPVLGLVLPSFDNPFFTETAGAVVAAAARHGWQVMMELSRGVDDPNAISSLRGRVDVAAGYVDARTHDHEPVPGDLPLIVLAESENADLRWVHAVVVDMHQGLADAVAALRAEGARAIGFLDSRYASSGGTYTPTLRARILRDLVPDLAAVVGTESIDGGAVALRELVVQHPGLDTVIAFNDLMGVGAVQEARELGIDVPGSLRIVGIDGVALGSAARPTLTSLAIDREAVAEGVMRIAASIQSGASTGRQVVRTVPAIRWSRSA